jgi:ABC-type multidrug transport system fused ATPase/permease subunit
MVSLGIGGVLYHRFKRVSHQICQSAIKQSYMPAMLLGIFAFLGIASWSLIFWFAGYLAKEERCNSLEIIRAISTAVYTASFSGAYLNQLPDQSTGWAAAKRVVAMLKLQGNSSALKAIEHHQSPVQRGKIVFENVSFSYPSRPEALVLDNVSFEIAAGSSAAFVGSSGSGMLVCPPTCADYSSYLGKSTVVALLERMYEPNSGQILVDDVDISQIDITAYRQSIGLVGQSPKLFDMSVADNIAYGLAQRPSDVRCCGFHNRLVIVCAERHQTSSRASPRHVCQRAAGAV